MTDETRKCGKCGDEYRAYRVIVRNNFSAMCDFQEIKEKYGTVCQECRQEKSYSKGGYAVLEQ